MITIITAVVAHCGTAKPSGEGRAIFVHPARAPSGAWRQHPSGSQSSRMACPSEREKRCREGRAILFQLTHSPGRIW
jgi:hypothetical protein